MAEFTDVQLIIILKKAARRVNRELCLFGTTSEIVVDESTGEISSPDEPALEDLVLMQAECMITQRAFIEELVSGAGGGILMRDGEQTFDNRDVGSTRGTFYNSTYSPCADIRRALAIEKMKRGGGPDGTPGRLIW